MHTELKPFGGILRRYIKRSGFTLRRFAAAANMHPSAISRICSGKRHVHDLPLDEWAIILGLNENDSNTLLAAAQGNTAPLPRERDLTPGPFYNGYWLAVNYSFRNDGQLARSLCCIEDGHVSWSVMHRGERQYSYSGGVEELAGKLFFRLAEDRGQAEYIQITSDGLFEFQTPCILYGLISGLSGRTMRQPYAVPCAAKMLLFYCGSPTDHQPNAFDRYLGTWLPDDSTPLLPPEFGDHHLLRRTLQLRPGEKIDSLLLRMLSNQLPTGHAVLQGGF